MFRLNGRAFALAVLFALPSAGAAQKEPPDTKELKDAQKFLGLAMMQSAPEKKKPLYEQAMTPLKLAMAKNPENAKVWLYAGQVYVGLSDFLGADSAFKKAEALHPAYAEDIAGEREVAWVEAFNAGIQAMDQNADEAIKQLELAELMYPHRPEAKMNLGALYAQKNQSEKAVQAFEGAIASTNGPLKEKLKPEDQANWKRYADMAKMNIAQIRGAEGVEEFNAQRWEAAAAKFQQAAQVNPYARDYWFNLGQAYYAQVGGLEEKRDSLLAAETALKKVKGKEAEAKVKADEAAKLSAQMLPLYAKIIELFEKTMQLDPANQTSYDLIGRSQKLTGDLAADAAQKTQWQNKALATFQAREALAFEVEGLTAVAQENQATIKGTVKALKAAPGSPIKFRITLLGIDGSTVGQQEVTVAAPATGQTAPFEAKAAVTGEVAGWKYEVLK